MKILKMSDITLDEVSLQQQIIESIPQAIETFAWGCAELSSQASTQLINRLFKVDSEGDRDYPNLKHLHFWYSIKSQTKRDEIRERAQEVGLDKCLLSELDMMRHLAVEGDDFDSDDYDSMSSDEDAEDANPEDS